MSKYRQTMSEALQKVYEQDKDHEISMARGELEAIADKATQLSAALQGKSDDGNPLEAWVQSKITKAKDYINSVSDYLMYNPEQANEELEEKTYDPATFGPDKVAKAMAIATKSSGQYTKATNDIEKIAKNLSKVSTIARELKKQNEQLEEKFTVQITKKDGTTMELGRYNTAAEAQRFVDMYGKGAKVKKEEFELEEASLKDIFTANQEGQKADEIAKKLKMSVADVKKILGEESIEEGKTDKEIDDFHKELDKVVHKHLGHSSKEKMDEKVAASIIKDLQKAYADLKGKTISPQMATKMSKHLDQPSYDLDTLRQLVKAKIPFVSTLARNKIYKKTGKFEDLKEEDGVEIAKIRAERDKEDKKEVASKEREVAALKDQVALLKQKLENEKHKAIKPEPNPETGEVPLTIGIANKLLKDKAEKEAKKKDMKEERRLYVESIAAVKKKAEKTGMPYSILKQEYDRGMAAWKGGHRPGATQVQWALARVNSFVTKSSGTWGGADKDLAKKVRGSK